MGGEAQAGKGGRERVHLSGGEYILAVCISLDIRHGCRLCEYIRYTAVASGSTCNATLPGVTNRYHHRDHHTQRATTTATAATSHQH